MIDYQLFQLAAPPHTEAEWITKSLQLAGLGYHSHRLVYQPFPSDPSSVLRVSVVRHPCIWLTSYYHKLREGKTEVNGNEPLFLLRRSSLEGFFRQYVSTLPGYITRMFGRYQADSFLRVEDLPWSLYELMSSLGVPKAMVELSMKLKCTPSHIRVDVNADLRSQLMNAEREFADAFDYF